MGLNISLGTQTWVNTLLNYNCSSLIIRSGSLAISLQLHTTFQTWLKFSSMLNIFRVGWAFFRGGLAPSIPSLASSPLAGSNYV